jgi:hypothetical protein
MDQKLMIGILGNVKSGKTHTWNLLFNKRSVKTSSKTRRLYFDENTWIDVFIISRSAQKRKMEVKSIMKGKEPEIVLCSMQYARKLSQTLKYFVDNHYFMYIHWLNPGYKDAADIPLFYDSDLVDYILSVPGMMGVRNGKEDATPRVREIRDFIYGWAKSRDLLKTKPVKIKRKRPNENLDIGIDRIVTGTCRVVVSARCDQFSDGYTATQAGFLAVLFGMYGP